MCNCLWRLEVLNLIIRTCGIPTFIITRSRKLACYAFFTIWSINSVVIFVQNYHSKILLNIWIIKEVYLVTLYVDHLWVLIFLKLLVNRSSSSCCLWRFWWSWSFSLLLSSAQFNCIYLIKCWGATSGFGIRSWMGWYAQRMSIITCLAARLGAHAKLLLQTFSIKGSISWWSCSSWPPFDNWCIRLIGNKFVNVIYLLADLFSFFI